MYATLIVYIIVWRQDPKQSFHTKDYSLSNQYKGRRHLKKRKKERKKNQKWPPSWTLSDTIWRSAIHPFSLSPTQNVLTLHHCQKTIRNRQFRWPFCFLCCSNSIWIPHIPDTNATYLMLPANRLKHDLIPHWGCFLADNLWNSLKISHFGGHFVYSATVIVSRYHTNQIQMLHTLFYPQID